MKITTKLIFLISTIFLINSCASTKEETSKTTVLKVNQTGLNHIETAKETHLITKTVYVPSSSSFSLGNPCDSLGNLKKLNFNTRIGNLKAQVSTLDGELQFSFSEIDSLISVIELKDSQLKKFDSISESQKSETTIDKKSKKKTVVWSKWTYIFLLGFLAVLYMLLSRWRKLIPTLF